MLYLSSPFVLSQTHYPDHISSLCTSLNNILCVSCVFIIPVFVLLQFLKILLQIALNSVHHVFAYFLTAYYMLLFFVYQVLLNCAPLENDDYISEATSRIPIYWLIFNNLHDSVKSVNIIPSIKTDHAPITLDLQNSNNEIKGPGFWKINCALLGDDGYINDVTSKVAIWRAQGRKDLSHNSVDHLGLVEV